MVRATPRYLDRSEEELEGMDPVEIALAPYRAHGSHDDRERSNRIRQILFPPRLIPHDDPRPSRSPSPPRNKRACIPASTNAIRGLKEVVVVSTMDDGCAICLKALAAGKVVHDKDATADDDLKALAALVADQDAHEEEEEEEEDDDDDDAADDEKKATDDDDDDAVTWLRHLRLRAMPCSHVFHQHCIFKWLSRNAAVCPLCRHKLPTTDDDE